MIFKFADFIECLRSGLKYLPNTLIMTFVPVVIGLIGGGIIAILRIYRVKVISQILAILSKKTKHRP